MNEDLQSPSSRYQQLKLRKEALEKKLNEKYEQLHQICQNVSRDDAFKLQDFNSSDFLGGYADRQQPGSHFDAFRRVVDLTQTGRHELQASRALHRR